MTCRSYLAALTAESAKVKTRRRRPAHLTPHIRHLGRLNEVTSRRQHAHADALVIPAQLTEGPSGLVNVTGSARPCLLVTLKLGDAELTRPSVKLLTSLTHWCAKVKAHLRISAHFTLCNKIISKQKISKQSTNDASRKQSCGEEYIFQLLCHFAASNFLDRPTLRFYMTKNLDKSNARWANTIDIEVMKFSY